MLTQRDPVAEPGEVTVEATKIGHVARFYLSTVRQGSSCPDSSALVVKLEELHFVASYASVKLSTEQAAWTAP